MVALLQWDGGLIVPDAYLQACTARADGQVPIAQAAHQVEGLAHRLRARQAQGVLADLRLDRCAHRRARAKEPVRGSLTLERLMRALEVVVLDEQPHPSLTVLEVREHRACEQLLPQRLPEPLDLPAGLRVVRAALHVRDAVAVQLGFKLRAPTPRRVLAPLVGQDLPRRSILGNPAGEGFEHQCASLVMRHRKTHQVAGVIIQKGRHVDPLVSAQQEREQIRLPQLVRLGSLKAHGLALRSGLHRRRTLQPLAPQHATHGRR
jgi:hypothetical protein